MKLTSELQRNMSWGNIGQGVGQGGTVGLFYVICSKIKYQI